MTNKIDNNFSYYSWVRMTKVIMSILDIIKIEKNIWYATCHTGFMYAHITYPRYYERYCMNIEFSFQFTKLSADFSSLSLVMGFSMKPYRNGCHKIEGICRIHECIYNK
jgi:hypothetical protein